VFLERAVPLAKSLRRDIVALGKRLETAADQAELACVSACVSKGLGKSDQGREAELRSVIADLKSLLARIDRDIPLLSLALSASGESLSTSMPQNVSPSRLLQASMLLNVGDTQYASATKPVQIGPSFTLSLYMLFVGHSSADTADQTRARPDRRPDTPSTPECQRHGEEPYGLDKGARRPIWQEVIHKARVRLCRTPIDFEFYRDSGYGPSSRGASANPSPDLARGATGLSSEEFAYHLEIVEDLDDGRVHDDGENVTAFDSMPLAGVRESMPIYQFSKIFYTDTGRILNLGNADDGDNHPILLLKRDQTAKRPTRMAELLEARAVQPPYQQLVGHVGASDLSDDQDELDRQLGEESERPASPEVVEGCVSPNHTWTFPSHLDPEWIALEVFEEDDSDSDEAEDGIYPAVGPRPARGTSRGVSLDSSVIEQVRSLSMASSPLTSPSSSSPLSPEKVVEGISRKRRPQSQESLVARSPFGVITTSLSLMEMLIRLTSLQEFQQMSHLAVPDHILTFFLEETSTTGLTGMERWKAHNEAKQKVGFDPYTDTPLR
jgi:hypothetical protein